MKEHVGEVDGTPNKRMYWAIISDYSLDTALCELVDNAIDNWAKQGRKEELVVELILNPEDQSIIITDNSGGVAETDHRQLISPGLSSNNPDQDSIGVFGVGSKRAVVALAKTIRIQTRHQSGGTFQFDIDEQWLSDPSWVLPKFETDSILKGSTRIELSRLRIPVSADDVKTLPVQLGKTYRHFLLGGNCRILVNRRLIKPAPVEAWSFPPGFDPICIKGRIPDTDGGTVEYELTAGLLNEEAFNSDEYGAYFYCNSRLIAGAIRYPEVGFVKGQAGVPHGEAALARVICNLKGPAKLMPWNSSKNGINYHHKTFRAIREQLIDKMGYYASLSRRLSKHKDEEVFCHSKGTIRELKIGDPECVQAVSLPPLPRVRRDYVEHLLADNRSIIRDQPWTLGLIESIAAVEILGKQKQIQTKNRIILLLLDSALEISLKEYLAHQPKERVSDKEFAEIYGMGGRPKAWEKVKQLLPSDSISPIIETKVLHFYKLRNNFVHQRATTEPTTTDVQEYRDAVQKVLSLLFGASFGQLPLDT